MICNTSFFKILGVMWYLLKCELAFQGLVYKRQMSARHTNTLMIFEESISKVQSRCKTGLSSPKSLDFTGFFDHQKMLPQQIKRILTIKNLSSSYRKNSPGQKVQLRCKISLSNPKPLDFTGFMDASRILPWHTNSTLIIPKLLDFPTFL